MFSDCKKVSISTFMFGLAFLSSDIVFDVFEKLLRRNLGGVSVQRDLIIVFILS